MTQHAHIFWPSCRGPTCLARRICWKARRCRWAWIPRPAPVISGPSSRDRAWAVCCRILPKPTTAAAPGHAAIGGWRVQGTRNRWLRPKPKWFRCQKQCQNQRQNQCTNLWMMLTGPQQPNRSRRTQNVLRQSNLTPKAQKLMPQKLMIGRCQQRTRLMMRRRLTHRRAGSVCSQHPSRELPWPNRMWRSLSHIPPPQRRDRYGRRSGPAPVCRPAR